MHSSSSKSGLTGTPRSAEYSYRSERFLFVEYLSIAKEANYTISRQLTESAIDELVAVEEYGEIEELIKNMHESS